jgi:hypothetical protein
MYGCITTGIWPPGHSGVVGRKLKRMIKVIEILNVKMKRDE